MNVRITNQTSPYIRKDTSTKRMMVDVLIALVPVVVFAIYKSGMSALTRLIVSVLLSVLFEATYILLFKRVEGKSFLDKVKKRWETYTINNITAPAVTGLILGLLLPDKISFYVIVIASFFAIFVAKMFFGGLGNNLLNPAAFGRLFAGFALTALFATSAYSAIDAVSGATALSLEFPKVLETYSLLDMIIGNIPGAMGEINSIAILIGGVYLLIRRSADYRPILSATLAFLALLIPAAFIIQENYWLEFIVYHIFSGGLLFGLFFMVTDPVTSPITRPGRWIYGMIIGVLVFLIRVFGAYPEGVAIALLIGNILVPLIDYPKWATNKYTKKFYIGYGVSLAVVVISTILVLGGWVI
ncbi:NADH oxidoreductase complex RnfABCDGE type, D subunit [Alteracholeplasma palmae J233]|uniref:NADH oxidoreductase complex RnfABCDGE type, D subunit n=1 Tax=Alteracholeplasma palmae (strain ATCC 49389 / J233) TaxID=1318466 RepID=U4KLZ3_ALTPJ|nr:RnfABCDGE type electron transport complex subunit D [Alteracholeplasma palmae]CCV64953.1 NADH oxidoreductase complex RnfABCDGE type, D subunit [Alteracholeplasma palmae J233]